jgi:hypothetical protein
VDQVSVIRSDGANQWQTQQKKTKTTIEMTAKLQNQAGVEQGVRRVEPSTT